MRGRQAKRLLASSMLVLFSLSVQAQISGLVADPEAKPPLKAQVELYSPDRPETPQRFDVTSLGGFMIIPSQTGVLRLNFTAAFHEPLGIALYYPKAEKVRLDVRLAPYAWVDEYKDVRAIGDFNRFDRNSGAAAFHPLSDGTYFVDVDNKVAGDMGYRLVGLVRDSPLSVPGTHFDTIGLDRNGRYVSTLKAKPGRMRILFDPALLPRSRGRAEVIFEHPKSAAARIASIDLDIARRHRDLSLALSAFRAAGHDEKDFRYDWSDDAAKLKLEIAQEKDDAVRQALWIAVLDLGKLGSPEVDRSTAQQALAAIPADSPLWELAPWYLLFDSLQRAGGLEPYSWYFQKAVNSNPSREVRALTLEQAYNDALARNDLGRAKEYFSRLTTDFADLLPGKRVKAKPPVSRFGAGKPMPAFRFTPLEGRGESLTNTTFKGKYVLIDFWAAWCEPCLAEMENLHTLQAKYKNKKFEILSVSFDKTPDDVRLFRKGKWAMPWRHAFVGMDEFRVGSKVCDYFELADIPRPILVDPSGTIVAAGTDAQGEKLAKALSKLLGD
jgi:thiol-disulfide isomerase/thioredoxin